MTDEKLEQILKYALAPKICDTEIKVYRKEENKMNKFNKIGKGIAATAAFFIIGICGLGCFNPGLAAKIPLVGRIFEKVGDNIEYSGDYADKLSVLTKEDSEGNLDTSEYSVSDNGITLTASEVYCDGYSMFLTLNVEAEDADFTHLLGESLYNSGDWNASGSSFNQTENSFWELLCGKVIDAHTFAGMLKIDFSEKIEGSGKFSLNLSKIAYDDDRMMNNEDIGPSHEICGNWNILLPFEVNNSDIKTIEIGEEKKNIILDGIMVSPYQVIVHTTTPPGKQYELTDNKRKELLSKNPDMTDAEMFELLGLTHTEAYVLMFNQDEEIFRPRSGNGWYSFPVQGKEIKTLHIFVFDDFGDFCEMKSKGINCSAADRAVIEKEIRVE